MKPLVSPHRGPRRNRSRRVWLPVAVTRGSPARRLRADMAPRYRVRAQA